MQKFRGASDCKNYIKTPSKKSPLALNSWESLGSGLFRLNQQIFEPDPKGTWISVSEAKSLLGKGFTRSLYPLLGQLLVYRRPSPATRIVSRKSVLALKAAIKSNPNFWESKSHQVELRAAVASEMRSMLEMSLQTACQGSAKGRGDQDRV